jgi:hypothetical protein
LLPLLRKTGRPAIPVIVFAGKEVEKEMACNVVAMLVKTRTSNDDLLRAVNSAIIPVNAKDDPNARTQ